MRPPRSLLMLTIMVMVATACGGSGELSSPTGAPTSGDQEAETDSDGDQESATEPGDSDDQSDQSDQGGQSDQQQPPPGGGDGSYTVDGQSFDAAVFRCQPSSSGGEANPDELSLFAFLGGSEGLEVEVLKSTRSAPAGPPYEATTLRLFYSRQGSDVLEQFDGSASTGPDGDWFNGNVPDLQEAVPLAEPSYFISGDRIAGSLMGLEQSWPQDGSAVIDVTFDFEIPTETTEGC